MNTLLVGYDLNKPAQDYARLIDALKGFGTYWHYLDSTWLVRTTLSAVELRDRLKKLIDDNDELLVLNVTGDSWATAGLTKANRWLQEHL